MKFFILLLSFGLACSSLLDGFDQEVDKLVGDVKAADHGLKSLKEHLGADSKKVLDTVESDIKEYTSGILKKYFQKARKDIEKVIEKAEGLSSQTEAKIQDFESKLEYLGEKQITRTKAGVKKLQREISGVVQKVIGPDGKQLMEKVESMSKKMTDPARISNVLIRELTSSKAIQDLREYVKNMPQEVEDALEIPVKKLMEVLSDKDIAELITYVLNPKESRSIFDIFAKIKKFFQDLGTTISAKFSSFRDWAQDHWSKAIETIKSKAGPYTALVKEFLGHAKDVSVVVAKQALEYFKAHKSEIAQLVFTKAIEAAKAAIAAG